MNVDCDRYSASRTIFETLAPQIVSDTFLGDEHWRGDEFKAFQKAVRASGWRYESLVFSLFIKQTVVRIF